MVTSVSHNDVRDLARILFERTETKARMLSEEAEWHQSKTKASAEQNELLKQVKALCFLICSVSNTNCPSGTHECSSGCCPDWMADDLCAQLNEMQIWPSPQINPAEPSAPTLT